MQEAHRQTRIAVINDDTPFLELMRELLQGEEGYQVHICREWEDAHGFVKQYQPDLVILDIVMGGEELGWKILNMLTLDPRTRSFPVIVCSAAIQSLHDHQELLSRYGIRALPKPFDLDTLLETVRMTLAERSPSRCLPIAGENETGC